MNNLFVIKKDYGFLHFCNVYFTRMEDSIRLKFTRTYTDPTSKETIEFKILNVEVNREDLLSRNDFKDVSEYGVFVRMVSVSDIARISNNFIYAEEQQWSINEVQKMMEGFELYVSQSRIVYTYLLNATCATMAQKVNLGELHTMSSGIRLLYFTVPFTSGFDFKNTPIVLSIPATAKSLHIDESFKEIAEGDGILTTGMMNEFASNKELLKPSLQLRFTNSEETVKAITVKATDNNVPISITARLTNAGDNSTLFKETEIILENINGYLPKNRVTIDPTTGEATFTIIPMHLSAGDFIRVKCGFFYYSGIDELKINLV